MTGLVAETAGAAAATATKGSSVWIASTASSASRGTTPSLCAQVLPLSFHREVFLFSAVVGTANCDEQLVQQEQHSLRH